MITKEQYKWTCDICEKEVNHESDTSLTGWSKFYCRRLRDETYIHIEICNDCLPPKEENKNQRKSFAEKLKYLWRNA